MASKTGAVWELIMGVCRQNNAVATPFISSQGQPILLYRCLLPKPERERETVPSMVLASYTSAEIIAWHAKVLEFKFMCTGGEIAILFLTPLPWPRKAIGFLVESELGSSDPNPCCHILVEGSTQDPKVCIYSR